jgi:uncharacterized Zn finger protein (UPF0148 family)
VSPHIGREYRCAACGTQLHKSGTGLGTWTCPVHAERWTTVPKDLSGGKEADIKSGQAQVPCLVKRHTLVRVHKG